MNHVLVAPANDYFDIVMVTRLLTQPEIDCPATRDRPPHTKLIHDRGDRCRGVHRNIVAPVRPGADRQIGAGSTLMGASRLELSRGEVDYEPRESIRGCV